MPDAIEPILQITGLATGRLIRPSAEKESLCAHFGPRSPPRVSDINSDRVLGCLHKEPTAAADISCIGVKRCRVLNFGF
jgi:hypothetical protein